MKKGKNITAEELRKALKLNEDLSPMTKEEEMEQHIEKNRQVVMGESTIILDIDEDNIE